VWTTELPKIVLADANTRTHKNIYVTQLAIDNDDEGIVFKGGLSANDLNTNSATAAGDPVYLSETAGGFTHTAPNNGNASVIPVGWVKTKSATVGEIEWYIFPIEKTDEASPAEVVTATNVITAAESGKTFFLNSATEFASTLPAPAAGLHYKFFVTAAPSGADYTVATEAAAQILAGQVYCSAGTDEDSETAFTATTINFVGGTSVIGDSADVWSDGTNWYARCFCNATGGITITG
jgi:hypothetical protein